MMYRLYCSSGNGLGLDEYISYSEIDSDGYWIRYLELKSSGMALRYSQAHLADSHGQLPEGRWDEDEASKPVYGIVRPISKELFESVWMNTASYNGPTT